MNVVVSGLLVRIGIANTLNKLASFSALFAQITFPEEYEIVFEPALKCRPIHFALAPSQVPRAYDDGTFRPVAAQSAHDSATRTKIREILTNHQKLGGQRP